MERRNLLFRRTDITVRIGKRLSAETTAHARAAEKPGTESIQWGWDRHWTPCQSSRCQQQQCVDPIWLATGDFHRDSPSHRCADDTDRTVAGDPLKNTLQMEQNRFSAVVSRAWSWAETETEQVGDEQLEPTAKQCCEPSVLQKTAIESMEQQEGLPLAENGNRKGRIDPQFREVPPLQLVEQRHGLGVQQIGADGLELGFQGR